MSESKHVIKGDTLPSGDIMPPNAIGFWKMPKDVCADMIVEAIKAGYRAFDFASDYGNEKECGEGLKRALDQKLCSREDLFITSKLWNTYHAKEHVRPALDRTLSDLGLDYLDLYLIHFPIPLQYVPFETRYPPEWVVDPKENKMVMAQVPYSETWGAMEQLVDAKKVRNIGVSHLTTQSLRDLLSYARIKPAVNQVEMHPYLVQPKLLRFCRENGVAVTAHSPLGALSYVELGGATEAESVLKEKAVMDIAQAVGKTAAQVVLRWGVQRGTSIVPKTSKPARMVENLSLMDFSLTEEQMKAIDGLDKHKRFNDPGNFCEGNWGCFCPIFD